MLLRMGGERGVGELVWGYVGAWWVSAESEEWGV